MRKGRVNGYKNQKLPLQLAVPLNTVELSWIYPRGQKPPSSSFLPSQHCFLGLIERIEPNILGAELRVIETVEPFPTCGEMSIEITLKLNLKLKFEF